jgi:hypothetical protein
MRMVSSEVNEPELPGSLGSVHVERNGTIVETTGFFIESTRCTRRIVTLYSKPSALSFLLY